MSNLELIFNKVLRKSYLLRYKNPNNFDGKGFWQPIKKILEKFDKYQATKWKKISKSKTHKIMLLPEYTINGYDEKNIIENNHFIIQQVRIPLNEKPTIKKVIQIALNIGQYKGTNKGKFIYDIKFNNIDQFLYKKDVLDLSKHLKKNIINKINKYLDSL